MLAPRPAFSRLVPVLSALTLCWFMAQPESANGQSISWGGITGSVVDELGEPVSDVELWLRNRITGSERTALSTRGGSFRIDGITPGAYELTAEAIGYRPKVVLSVQVRAGDLSRIQIVLMPERPPVLGRDTVSFVSPGGSWMIPGGAQSLQTPELGALPDQSRTLDDALLFSTALREGMGGEGLSATHAEIFVDGLPFRVARHPSGAQDPNAFMALPRSALSLGEVLTGDPEIEWARSAGPAISVFTRSSGGRRAWNAAGDFSGLGLWSSSQSDGEVPTGYSVRARAAADVPLSEDGPRIALGAEFERLEAVRPQFGVPAEMVAGLDLSTFADPYLTETTRASAFGRLDWKLDQTSAVAGRILFGTVLEPSGPFAGAPLTPGHPMSAWGTDISALATYSTEIENRFRTELRVGFDRSDRQFGGAREGTTVYPLTQFTSSGLSLGTEPIYPADVTWQTFHASPVFYLDYDEHQFKVGGYLALPTYSYDYTFNQIAEVYTDDASTLAGGQGFYTLTNGAAAVPDFSLRSFSLFAGDVWDFRPDMRLKAGVRFDQDQLPEGWQRSVLWDSLSTRPRPAFPTDLGGLSGQLGLEWDAAPNMVVHANAGLRYQPTDPAVIASVLYEDGGVFVRHGMNGLLVWPDMSLGPVNHFAPRLTFLGEDFENPRAVRVSAGISRSMDNGLTGHVWVVGRRTESMTRRRDLNRAAAPTGLDQDGRAVYGPLFKRRSVIGATWPDNRQIRNFEHVFALESDGWSEYGALGLAIEDRSGGPLSWFVSYTLSRAEDNIVGAGSPHPQAQLNPFNGTDLAETWGEGRSDFDVPHRVAGGMEWVLPGVRGIRIGGRYSLQSGRPFTPGFRRGVDVNGDGSVMNDPAFIGDGNTLGTLLSEWGCLGSTVGGFAQRNGCRAPLRHTLDARFTLSSLEVGGQLLEITVDALNVLDAKEGERDGAVFLIDPATPITQVGSVNQIPYLANPGFGDLLRPTGPGRWFRVGVRLLPGT